MNNMYKTSLKHLKTKENIIFLIITVLIFLALYILLTIAYFVIDYQRDLQKYSVDSRSLIVYNDNKSEQQLDEISNISHVIVNVSNKYYSPFYTDLDEFTTGDEQGYGSIKAMLTKDDVKIIKGRNVLNDYEVVVPVRFYPHDEFSVEKKDYKKNILNGNDLIGSEIKVRANIITAHTARINHRDPDYEEKMEEIINQNPIITFKIVGTYDSKDNLVEMNTFYGTMGAIDLLKSDISGGGYAVYVDGTEEYTDNYYEDRLVRVDEYKNYEYVKTELAKKGYSFSEIFEIDKTIDLFFYIPLAISVVLIIIIFALIYNFILKKYRIRHINIGLLKAIGYSNKQINKIELVENLIITIISVVLSFIIYLIVYFIVTNYFLGRFDYYSVILEIPYLYNLILVLIALLYIIFINNKIGKKFLKYPISELLKED